MLKYGSPEFWNVLAPWVRYVTAYGGAVCCWGNQPVSPNGIWLNAGGRYATASVLDIDPATIPPWQESLIERPYTWLLPTDDTPIDTPVWIRAFGANPWLRRHWLGYRGGKMCVWRDGYTSWSAAPAAAYAVQYIVLADPNNPDRVPPVDWTPEVSR